MHIMPQTLSGVCLRHRVRGPVNSLPLPGTLHCQRTPVRGIACTATSQLSPGRHSVLPHIPLRWSIFSLPRNFVKKPQSNVEQDASGAHPGATVHRRRGGAHGARAAADAALRVGGRQGHGARVGLGEVVLRVRAQELGKAGRCVVRLFSPLPGDDPCVCRSTHARRGRQGVGRPASAVSGRVCLERPPRPDAKFEA